jgi:hypothetical protein
LARHTLRGVDVETLKLQGNVLGGAFLAGLERFRRSLSGSSS